MPKLQLSYAPEKHGFCHPAPSDFMKLAEMSVLHLTHLKSNSSSGEIYDKETIKICNQLSSYFMVGEKNEHPSLQQGKINGTSNDEIKTQDGI